jgi:ABC-type lipoprotein release transport system permease subunit
MRRRPWSGPLLGRAVRSRAVRMAIVVCGVAIGTLLVLVLAAAYRSVTAGVESYVGQRRIDLWVAPRGSDNLIRSSAMLPGGAARALSKFAGVKTADPMLRAFVSVTSARRSRPLTLLALGYRGPDGLGAPPNVIAGRRPAGDGEVTLDRAAAYRLRVAVGDSVALNDRPFAVVGLSTGTNLLATQFAFVDGAAAERAAGVFGSVSFVGIELVDGADPAAVKRGMEERYDDIRVFDRTEWVKNNVSEVAAGLLPLLFLVSIVGAVSATLLVALLVQGAVDDRRRDIAILFALGAPASAVGWSLAVHAEALVLGGGVIGAALTMGLDAVLRTSAPVVELAPRASDFAWVILAFVLASLAATLAQLLRLRRIDPVEAFRP